MWSLMLVAVLAQGPAPEVRAEARLAARDAPVRLEVELLPPTALGDSVALTQAPTPTGETGFAELPRPTDAPAATVEPSPGVVAPSTAPPPTVTQAPAPVMDLPPLRMPGARLRFTWVGVGLTAAALLTGAIAGTVASSASGTLRDGTTRPRTEADGLVATTTTAAAVANGAWVAAGALGLATGVTMAVEW